MVSPCQLRKLKNRTIRKEVPNTQTTDLAGYLSKRSTRISSKASCLKTLISHLDHIPKSNLRLATYAKDGLLYRKGIDAPFSGRLFDESEDGVILLEVSFLEGKPHGAHIRRNRQNNITMEAFFDHGVLSGVKTKWWPNGLVNEEEYWDEGSYKGKKVWDETGRLLKDERVD